MPQIRIRPFRRTLGLSWGNAAVSPAGQTSYSTEPGSSPLRVHLLYGEDLGPLPAGIASAIVVWITASPSEPELIAFGKSAASLVSPGSSGTIPVQNQPSWACDKITAIPIQGSVANLVLSPPCPSAGYRIFLSLKEGHGWAPRYLWGPMGTASSTAAVIAPSAGGEMVAEVIEYRGLAKAKALVEGDVQAGFYPTYMGKGMPDDPSLAQVWGDLGGAMTAETDVPARETPVILERWSVIRQVFEEIPFFKIGEKDYVRRCMWGFPFFVSPAGIPLAAGSLKLLSPTWSNYFPREKAQIHADLAATVGANLESLFGCVEHKLQKRAREVERTMRLSQFVGGVAKLIIAGAIGVGAGSMIPYAAEIVASAFPDYAAYIQAGGKAISVAIGQLGGAGAGFAIDSLTDQIASGAINKAVEMMVELASSFGPQSAKSLIAAATGIGEVEAQSAPFVLWLLVAPKIGPVIAMGAQALGYDVDLRKDVIDPLLEKAAQAGMPIPEYLKKMAAENAAQADRGKEIISGESELRPSDAEPIMADDGLMVAVAAGGVAVALALGIV